MEGDPPGALCLHQLQRQGFGPGLRCRLDHLEAKRMAGLDLLAVPGDQPVGAEGNRREKQAGNRQ
jgi:hypothetical protein